jgi:hypothetical protein
MYRRSYHPVEPPTHFEKQGEITLSVPFDKGKDSETLFTELKSAYQKWISEKAVHESKPHG